MKKKEGSELAKGWPRPKSGEQLIPRERWTEEVWHTRGSAAAVLRLSEEEREMIEDVSFLYEQYTLKEHKKAQDLIEEGGFSGGERFKVLHEEEDEEIKHEFSEVGPEHINPFAYIVLEWLLENNMLNEKSITLELGSGFGNDALLIARNSKAHVTAVDKADAGIKAAQKELRKPDRKEYLRWIETGLRNIADRHGQDFGKTRAYLHSLVLEGRCTADVIMKEDRIGLEGDKFKEEIAKCIGQMNSARADFGTEDYRDTLESYYRMGLTMIYSLSTLHYILPHVLEEEISPMIADALRDEEGNPTGVFCVGMKLAGSASAQSSDQIRLAPGSKYNPSYHTVDGIARIYPETKEDVIALFPDFDVIDCKVEDNPDYDKKGDVEKMCQLILRPKQGKPVRQGEAAKMAKAA